MALIDKPSPTTCAVLEFGVIATGAIVGGGGVVHCFKRARQLSKLLEDKSQYSRCTIGDLQGLT